MNDIQQALFDYFCAIVTEILFGDTTQYAHRNIVRSALEGMGVKKEIDLFIEKSEIRKQV